MVRLMQVGGVDGSRPSGDIGAADEHPEEGPPSFAGTPVVAADAPPSAGSTPRTTETPVADRRAESVANGEGSETAPTQGEEGTPAPVDAPGGTQSTGTAVGHKSFSNLCSEELNRLFADCGIEGNCSVTPNPDGSHTVAFPQGFPRVKGHGISYYNSDQQLESADCRLQFIVKRRHEVGHIPEKDAAAIKESLEETKKNAKSGEFEALRSSLWKSCTLLSKSNVFVPTGKDGKINTVLRDQAETFTTVAVRKWQARVIVREFEEGISKIAHNFPDPVAWPGELEGLCGKISNEVVVPSNALLGKIGEFISLEACFARAKAREDPSIS
jgi:hypothetical protein